MRAAKPSMVLPAVTAPRSPVSVVPASILASSAFCRLLIGLVRELAAAGEPLQGEGVIEMNGKRYAVSGITSPAHIAGLPENVRRAIVGWGWDRNQNFTLKLADKSKALDQLARHLSLYNDRLEVASVEGLGDRIKRAKARAAAYEASLVLPAPSARRLADTAPAPEAPPAEPAATA